MDKQPKLALLHIVCIECVCGSEDYNNSSTNEMKQPKAPIPRFSKPDSSRIQPEKLRGDTFFSLYVDTSNMIPRSNLTMISYLLLYNVD